MVDMDMKLCSRVLTFKMSDSKGDPWAFPIQPTFCSDYFSLTTEGLF